MDESKESEQNENFPTFIFRSTGSKRTLSISLPYFSFFFYLTQICYSNVALY